MEKIVFLLIFSSLHLAKTDLTFQDVECTENWKTYFLSQNLITYFRSPSYPTSLAHPQLKCNAIFQTVDTEIFFWVAMFNGNTPMFFIISDEDYHSLKPYNSNKGFVSYSAISTSLRFFLDDSAYRTWTAFEGIVAVYNIEAREHSCPLANETISLEDGKVIPIASDFNTTLSNTTCWWKFQINSNNQRFKIVIQHVNFTKLFSLDLETDGKIIAKFNNTYKQLYPMPYYFESNSGSFILNFNSVDFYNNGFFAIVSAVSKTFHYPNKQCKRNDGSIANGDFVNGYQPYDQCNAIITIPDHQEIYINAEYFYIEENADKVTLTTLKNNNSFLITDNFNYLLTSEVGDSKIEFVSDGSIQQGGFYLAMVYMDCKCADSIQILDCEYSTSITILNPNYIYDDDEQSAYCSNMKCNFIIQHNETCAPRYFKLTYKFSVRDDLDYTLLYNNGELLENVTSFQNIRVFSSSTNITLQFFSGNASPFNQLKLGSLRWNIEAEYIDLPTIFPTIYLNETVPTYVSWLNNVNVNTMIVVCSTAINDTMEMFVTRNVQALSNYSIYYGTDLINFVTTLDSPTITSHNGTLLRSMVLLSNCVTLYNYHATNSYYLDMVNTVVLFRLKNANTKNCKNTNNVFLTPDSSSINSFVVHGEALSTGECELILLSGHTVYEDITINFGNFTTTTSQTGPVIFKSTLNRKEYFRVLQNEASFWEKVSIDTPSLTVIIPKSSDITFYTNPLSHYLSVSGDGTKGVLCSGNYGGFPTFQTSFNVTNKGYRNVTITVKYLRGNQTVNIQSDWDHNYHLTADDNTIKFNSKSFSLSFYSQIQNYDMFLAEFAYNNLPSTTTRTSTTTTTTTTKKISTISSTPSTTTKNSASFSPSVQSSSASSALITTTPTVSILPTKQTTSTLPMPTKTSGAPALFSLIHATVISWLMASLMGGF